MSAVRPNKLIIEDARILSEPTNVEVFIKDQFTNFSCTDPNWRYFSWGPSILCCYIDPDLRLDDYSPNSFTHKFLTNNGKCAPIKNARINHTVQCLYVRGSVNVNLFVNTTALFKTALVNNAVVAMVGRAMNLCVHEKVNSVISISGTVSTLHVDMLETSCVLDMSRCTMPPGRAITYNSLATTGFISDISEFLRPVPTTRQIHVKHGIKVDADAAEMTAACSDDPPDTVCQLCFVYLANAKYLPCGHTHGCMACAEKMQTQELSNFTCPWCRAEIEHVDPVTQKQRIK